MSHFTIFAAAFAVALSAFGAEAATVASGGTQVPGTTSGTTAYVSPQGNLVSVSDPSNAWILGDMPDAYAPAVWVNADSDPAVSQFTFAFDLAGYDVGSAALSVLLALDDYISVTLNGEVVFTDNDQGAPGGNNWSVFQTFTVSNFFKSGINVLAFTVTNTGGPGGLRASTIVTATPSAVPVPAGLPLLAGGLLALGAVARRRKQA